MLIRFNRAVAMLNNITVTSLPHTISLRRAGLLNSVRDGSGPKKKKKK